MPRFQQLTGSFEITTGSDTDPVTWRFERTPEVEREFTLADDPGRSRPHTRALLPVMLSALADWEGVLDADGRLVEYSEQAFYEYIPSSMRLELLSHWTRQMRGADGGTGGPAREGVASTRGVAHEEVPGSGFGVRGSGFHSA